MLRVFGQCYEIRERLRSLGCVWDNESKEWFAPDDAHAQAQSLADIENFRLWDGFLSTLPWSDGSLTGTVWEGSLRAASLYIPFTTAWTEIAGRVRGIKAVGDKWFDRNIARAYDSIGADKGSTWKIDRPAREEKKEKAVFRNYMLDRVAGPWSEAVSREWLAARSPVDPRFAGPVDFLASLYEPGERVVVFDVFASQGQWVWNAEHGLESSTVFPAALYQKAAVPFEKPGRDFDARGREGVWYLCNPVSGQWRWMEEGSDDPHWSRRFHECVTSWRYMVLESDKADPRSWVAMAVQLPLRIAAIYTSGGKSIHVLVRVDAKSKMQWDGWRDEMRDIVVTLGADPGCLSAVRLTRLPGCLRLGKIDSSNVYRLFPRPHVQRLLYLNPSPDMTPIQSRPVLRAVEARQ